MPHVLDNANLWIGDGTQMAGHVVIEGDTINAVAPGRYSGDAPVTDLGGANLSPGLIDLMVLGGFDRSILRDDPQDIAREYLKLGVTSCQFCTGTLPWDAQCRVVDNVKAARDISSHDAAQVIGVYLEGPFQDPERTGASLKENALLPTDDNVQRVLDRMGDPLTMINIAPGHPKSPDGVRAFCEAGVTVSMAHSDASADDVLACVEAGTSVLGHMWDNNSGRIGDSGVQQPTIEHVAMVDERVRFIHLICDGTHVHPLLIKLAIRTRGIESLCIVTDAIPKAGMADGAFVWDDGRTFYKKLGVGRTSEHGLAGSATLLPDMLRNFISFTDTPPHEAIRAATLNPAASIGIDDQTGVLAPGRRADLALWDDQLNLLRVWRLGKAVPTISDFAEIELGKPQVASVS